MSVSISRHHVMWDYCQLHRWPRPSHRHQQYHPNQQQPLRQFVRPDPHLCLAPDPLLHRLPLVCELPDPRSLSSITDLRSEFRAQSQLIHRQPQQRLLHPVHQ
jgi:hypothetical protein